MVHQVLREIVARGLVQARRVDLGKATTLDPTVKDMPVTTNVGVALHMGKNRRDAHELQLEHDIVDIGGQVLVGQFQQEVRAAGRKGQDVTLLHPVGQVGADEGLVAGQNGERDGLAM